MPRAVSELTPSNEQVAIVENACAGESFRILAFAGTGKTTTLEMIAQAMPARQILYLVFNQAQATMAKSRFGALPNVRVMTAHGLAFPAVGAANQHRFASESVAARTWVQFMTARGAFEDVVPDRRPRFGRTIVTTLTRFIASADRAPDVQHVPKTEFDPEAVAHLTRRLWRSLETSADLPVTHDWYLKVYQLSRPVLKEDVILYDEAQDVTSCQVDCTLRQEHMQQIYCGDPHQQLYAWRGAENRIQNIALPALPLTETRRFGPEIAAAANAILNIKGEALRIRGIAPYAGATRIGYAENPDVVLSRTNAGLVAQALTQIDRGAKVFIRGGTDPATGRVGSGASELMSGLLAAFDLRNGRTTTHSTFASFQSWEDLTTAAEEDGGESLRPFVRLVERHAKEVPRVVARIRDNALPTEDGADTVLSTVHRFKGEERPIVSLANDFQDFVDDRGRVEVAEANVLYVALSRSRRELHYGGAYTTLSTSMKRRGVDVPLTASPTASRPTTGYVPLRRSMPVAAAPPARSFGDYVPGSRWDHPHYGTIVIADATPQLLEVTTASGEKKKLATLLARDRLTPAPYSEG